MTDDLRDELLGIHGIGEAKADEIMALVDEHGHGDVAELIEDAHDYHEAGEHEYAAKYVRRAYDALE